MPTKKEGKSSKDKSVFAGKKTSTKRVLKTLQKNAKIVKKKGGVRKVKKRKGERVGWKC